MSVTWNILWNLPWSVSLTFTTLLKNQVEYIFLAPLSCRHLYASYWFSRDIFSLTKSLPGNFEIESSWDLVLRFLCLYMTNCFCLQYLNFIITLPNLFILWQAYRPSGVMSTPVKDNAWKALASKTLSWISAGTGFTSIVSHLLYWEFITALGSTWIILLRRWALKLLHCCNSE